MLFVAPFGGAVDLERVESHSAALSKRNPNTSSLLNTCRAGDAGVIGALQQQRDWLAVLSTQFFEVATEASDAQ